MEEYLVHHGVKGMKWGVRKQFQAAHRFRKSNKSNAIRVSKQYGDRIRGLEKRHEIEGEKIGDWGSAQGRKLMDRQYDEMKALKEEGRKAVNKAALLDAGYTEEQAEVGFKWMSDQEKKGSKYVMYKIKHSNEDDAFLVHHGILGMKWGVRRYQNKDGSLTESGKKRYSSELHYNIEKQAKSVFNNSYQNKTGDSYMTELISSKISDEESIKNVSKAIKKEAQLLNDLHNDYYKEFGQNANRIMQSPAFKKELEKKLSADFGTGVDDKEYFDMVRDEYIQNLFYDDKFKSQKLKQIESQINNKYNDYSNMIESATNDLVKDFGDKQIDDKYSIKYKDVVKKAVATNSGIGWAAYSMKNREELAYYENSYMPSESSYNSVYTYEEYNRKH